MELEKIWDKSKYKIPSDVTAQKIKFSIKDFFSKCVQTALNFGFGHIYWRNP